MSLLKVTTVQQARQLPEIESAFYIEGRRTLEADEQGVGKRGHTVIWRTISPFCPAPVDGDQILFFRDADGRLMQIVYTPDGPAKCVFHGY